MTTEMYRLPLERRVLGPILAERARTEGDRPYLTLSDTGKTFSFGDTDRIVRSVARGLKSRGIKRGDRVAMLLPNGAEFVWTWYACALLGAPMVPINNTYSGALLEYVLADSGARGMVVHRELARALDTIAPEVRAKLEWVVEAEELLQDEGPDPEAMCDHR